MAMGDMSMEERGMVIGIEDGYLVVSFVRGEICGTKDACGGCSDATMTCRATNLCEAGIGDYVELEAKPWLLSKGVLLLYGMPLAAMILGFVLGNAVAGELAAFFVGMGFLGASWGFLRYLGKRRKVGSFIPMAVRKLDSLESAGTGFLGSNSSELPVS